MAAAPWRPVSGALGLLPPLAHVLPLVGLPVEPRLGCGDRFSQRQRLAGGTQRDDIPVAGELPAEPLDQLYEGGLVHDGC
jgi:hypothetical protein